MIPGMGTIVNVAAILLGGCLGLAGGRFLSKRFQDILNAAIALSIIFMSVASVLAKMLVPLGQSFEVQGIYVLIFSLVLGALSGEALDIDRKLEAFGNWLRARTGNSGDKVFVEAFVTTSLTVCIGAMAVMGALLDGISGDPSILFTKAILDSIIILIMTSSMGKGCIFSALPVAVFQGSITLAAVWVAPLMTDQAVKDLSLVGSVLIFCVGVNIMAQGRFVIKVANLLPAIFFAVAAAYIPWLG